MTPLHARTYHVSLRIWLLVSVAMALAASASTLAILYLARPFIASRGGLAPEVQNILFAATATAGGLAGIGGLVVGVG